MVLDRKEGPVRVPATVLEKITRALNTKNPLASEDPNVTLKAMAGARSVSQGNARLFERIAT
jgi:hypothetical protein